MGTQHVSRNVIIVGDSPNKNAGEHHPFTMVDGAIYHTDMVGIDPRASAVNYGLARISGYGAWRRPEDDTHWMFRPEDHMTRIHQNALAIPVLGDFPSTNMLVDWSITSLGLGIPHLTRAKDVYGRTLVVQGGVALGVGTRGHGHVINFTRDLTEYVPAEGLDLLFPGMLCRRPNIFMGRPFEKAAGNYDLAHFWKGVVAKGLGFNEILMLNWNGTEIAETSGSIPVAIVRLSDKKIQMRVPRLESGRLNSITTDTLIYLAHKLGWEVIVNQRLTLDHLIHADELWVAGSWSGLASVRNISLDQRWMREAPILPPEIFRDGVGPAYKAWLDENFQPVNARKLGWTPSFAPGPLGTQLRELYWGVVRNRPEFRRIDRPSNWNVKVNPIVPNTE
ncbi:MAG: aminotransferase class IV [bacterium]|nr:aminotransferase class IV [bacterium]